MGNLIGQSRRERARNQGRIALMKFGRSHGKRIERKLHTFFRYVDLGIFAGGETGGLPPHWHDRYDLFREALRHVDGTAPLYLEFGVYQGTTMQWWCDNLPAEDAHFVGFDSFEGLPEDWNPHAPKGMFAVDTVPVFEDPRASVEVGWFEDTLPKFTLPKHDQLIVNIDSDLYSSANYVLAQLEEALVPGTLVYLDELSDRDHELRAWREFLGRTGRRVEALGMSSGGVNWLFRIVA